MIRLLTEGEVFVVEHVIYERDEETGRLKQIKKKVTTSRKGTPKWVFDKMMPDPLVKALQEAGVDFHIHRHEGGAHESSEEEDRRLRLFAGEGDPL